MLRKICNYLAVVALSLVVSGNAVLAGSTVGKDSKTVKSVKVVEEKDTHFYQAFLRTREKHSYTIKVKAGQKLKVKIHATESVALQIRTPGGQTQNSEAAKYFELKLDNEGEYVVEMQSPFFSQYMLEIYPKA